MYSVAYITGIEGLFFNPMNVSTFKPFLISSSLFFRLFFPCRQKLEDLCVMVMSLFQCHCLENLKQVHVAVNKHLR